MPLIITALFLRGPCNATSEPLIWHVPTPLWKGIEYPNQGCFSILEKNVPEWGMIEMYKTIHSMDILLFLTQQQNQGTSIKRGLGVRTDKRMHSLPSM